jgi:hypothetical protein
MESRSANDRRNARAAQSGINLITGKRMIDPARVTVSHDSFMVTGIADPVPSPRRASRNVWTYAPIRLEFVPGAPCQAIVTRCIGATNYKPARIRATASAGNLIMSQPHDATSDDAVHHAAARALCARFGWHGTLACGGMPDGQSRVFVFIPK